MAKQITDREMFSGKCEYAPGSHRGTVHFLHHAMVRQAHVAEPSLWGTGGTKRTYLEFPPWLPELDVIVSLMTLLRCRA